MTVGYLFLLSLFIYQFFRYCNGDCGGNWTSFIGAFSTPDYPLYYKNNLDCLWHIRIDDGFMIKLALWDIHVEGPYVTCRADYLRLAEGNMDSVAKEIWRRCDRGIEEPVVYYSLGNELWLGFHSDGNARGRGFNASYNAIRTIYQYDFESIDLIFNTSSLDDLQWKRMSGPDDSYYSGPTEDHTYGNSSGTFMLARTERGNSNMKSFSMVLPPYQLFMTSSSATLQLSYHMWYAGFARAAGSLQIYVCGNLVLFEEGNKKDIWHTAEIDIGNEMENCTVTITAVTLNIDIAIDDVTIYEVMKEDYHVEDTVTFVTDVILTEQSESSEINNGDSPNNNNNGGDPAVQPTRHSLVVLTTEDIAFIAITSLAIMLVFLISILVYVLIRLKRREKKVKSSTVESATFTNSAYSTILDDHMRDDVTTDVSLEPPIRWERIDELSNGKIDEMLIVYNVAYQSVDKYHDNSVKPVVREKQKRNKRKVNFQTIKEENETDNNRPPGKGKR